MFKPKVANEQLLAENEIIPGTSYLEFTKAVINGINTTRSDESYRIANDFICALMDADDGTKFDMVYEACVLAALSVPQDYLEPAKLKDWERFHSKYRTKFVTRRMLNV